MSPLPRLSLGIFTTIVLSQGMALSAIAADQNTYRPGQAYLKTAGQSYQVCAQQCQGDAQCRGWNFVRPNPRTATGICEFNSRAATPVASAISISGEVTTSVDPLMSRAIPAGSNTRRVGTPIIETRAKTMPTRQPTQVRRMPVPAPRQSLQPIDHRRPVAEQPKAPQSRAYGGPTQTTAPQTVPGQALSPQQRQYRQQFLAERQRQEQMRAQQQAALRQQQFQRPQMTRRPIAAPVTAPPQYGPQPLPSALRALAPRPNPQSLYGSLHDDLTKDLTAVPRPQTAPDNLNNPDAPVSTSRAAPAKPVETAPLKNPVISGLAGAEQ